MTGIYPFRIALLAIYFDVDNVMFNDYHKKPFVPQGGLQITWDFRRLWNEKMIRSVLSAHFYVKVVVYVLQGRTWMAV